MLSLYQCPDLLFPATGNAAGLQGIYRYSRSKDAQVVLNHYVLWTGFEFEPYKGSVIKMLLHLYTFSHNLLLWWQDIALFIQLLKLGHQL